MPEDVISEYHGAMYSVARSSDGLVRLRTGPDSDLFSPKDARRLAYWLLDTADAVDNETKEMAVGQVWATGDGLEVQVVDSTPAMVHYVFATDPTSTRYSRPKSITTGWTYLRTEA
jgi:hypothetical protein